MKRFFFSFYKYLAYVALYFSDLHEEKKTHMDKFNSIHSDILLFTPATFSSVLQVFVTIYGRKARGSFTHILMPVSRLNDPHDNDVCTYLSRCKWLYPKHIVFSLIFTARKRSLGQGNVFTHVCDSVHKGGGVHSPRQTPPLQTPPRQTPPYRDGN